MTDRNDELIEADVLEAALDEASDKIGNPDSEEISTENIGETEDNIDSSKYKNIGGWLILPIIGLILTSIRGVYNLITYLYPALSNGIDEMFTNPESAYYNPFLKPTILFETISNTLICAFIVVILIYCFKKKKAFPKLIITYYLLNLVCFLADYLLISRIIAITPELGIDNSTSGIVGIIAVCCVWIPYFLKSKRVKGTFVN